MFTNRGIDKKLLLLAAASIALKLFSMNEVWVERLYTYGIYPHIAALLRFVLGWICISVGDILYAVAGGYLIIKVIGFMRLLYTRQTTKALLGGKVLKLLKLLLAVYLLFNIFWGLNYNRLGIAHQLRLEVVPFSEKDLTDLLAVLNERLCYYAEKTDSLERVKLQSNSTLFAEGYKTFERAQSDFPFLAYHNASLKASLYSPLGHYFGFTGYYNPFTAEAQIKTSIPVFLKPFVLCHEIGHQVGYAKENEANFISFLACRKSGNYEFRYSVYFEMWLYTWYELRRRNSIQSFLVMKSAHPQVQKDYKAFMAYLTRTENTVEPYISLFYDRYLKLNNQPKGKATYNEVVAWMMAYLKKKGPDAI